LKKSESVTLIMLGTLMAISLYSHEEHDTYQQRYNSKDECQKDWEERDCSNNSIGGHGGSGWSGPRYYWDRNEGRPMIVEQDGTARPATNVSVGPNGSATASARQAGTISRGGFGGTSHRFSSGG